MKFSFIKNNSKIRRTRIKTTDTATPIIMNLLLSSLSLTLSLLLLLLSLSIGIFFHTTLTVQANNTEYYANNNDNNNNYVEEEEETEDDSISSSSSSPSPSPSPSPLPLPLPSSPSTIVDTIGYQLHSSNDLEEWDQWLLKGGRSFKIDPFWKPVEECFNYAKLDHRGCFILSHDEPLRFIHYNTTWDLLTYLGSESFQIYSRGEKIRIALCFKESPFSCSQLAADVADANPNSNPLAMTAGKNWLSLVDQFHNHAQMLIEEKKLNIEFILDGDAKPTDCLYDRWKPWQSVWINGSGSPIDAFTSNEISKGYNRFQILNDKAILNNWQYMAQDDVNYGKFNRSKYPYQIWEPSEQNIINQFEAVYFNGSSQHPPGFNFAINMDPAMFQIFHSSVKPMGIIGKEKDDEKIKYNNNNNNNNNNSQITMNGWNEHLLTAGDEEKPIVIPFIYDEDEHIDFIVFYRNKISSNYLYQTFTTDKQFGILTSVGKNAMHDGHDDGPKELSDTDFLYNLKGNSNLFISKIDQNQNRDMILIANEDAKFEVFHYQNDGNHLKFVFRGDLPSPNKNDFGKRIKTFNMHAFVPPDYEVIHIAEIFESISCGLGMHILRYPFGIPLNELDVSTMDSMRELCLDTIHRYDSADVAIIGKEYAALIFASSENNLYGTYWSWRLLDMIPEMHQIGVGKHVRVGYSMARKIPVEQEIPVIMVVAGDSYCYNSEYHNKRSIYRVCESTPSSTKEILSYWYGIEADWQSHFSQAAKKNKNNYLITSCHKRILMGTYDMGSHPQVSLYTSPSTGTVYMAAVHEGFQNKTCHDSSTPVRIGGTCSCGRALNRNGIVLDAFSLSDGILNDIPHDLDPKTNNSIEEHKMFIYHLTLFLGISIAIFMTCGVWLILKSGLHKINRYSILGGQSSPMDSSIHSFCNGTPWSVNSNHSRVRNDSKCESENFFYRPADDNHNLYTGNVDFDFDEFDDDNRSSFGNDVAVEDIEMSPKKRMAM